MPFGGNKLVFMFSNYLQHAIKNVKMVTIVL